MVIVPKAHVTQFLLGSPSTIDNFRAFLQRLKQYFRTRQAQHGRELILQTCQRHLTLKYANAEMKDLFLGQIALAGVFLADQELFRKAVQSVTDGFDTKTFFELGALTSFQAPVIPEAE